ncbi:hypothetical protein V8E55_003200 [Tylopilus felleus]
MSWSTKVKIGLTEKLEMAAACCWRGQLCVAGYEGEIDGETGDGSHVLQAMIPFFTPSKIAFDSGIDESETFSRMDDGLGWEGNRGRVVKTRWIRMGWVDGGDWMGEGSHE